MGSIRTWLQALLAVSSLFAGGVIAQTYDHSVYLDLDNNAATGCNVVTAAGAVNGAEARISATVSGNPPMVTGVTRALCAGGVFGAAQPQPGAYAVGLDNGTGGADVIELATSLAGLGQGGPARFTFVSSTAAGADLASGIVQLPGSGLVNPTDPILVPSTGIITLLLLIGLVFFVVRRHPGIATSAAIVLMLGAGVVWAANFVVDGQVGDWVGVPPLAVDPANDSTSADPHIEVVAVFAAAENGNLFMRFDVQDAQAPGNNPPVANDANFTLAENSAAGTAVGTVMATDPNVGQTLTYAITAGNGSGAFAINAATGAITVANATPLDFEATPNFTLTVTVTDNFAPPASDTATVLITLTDANEAPVLADATRAVAEDSPNGTAVGAPLVGSDPDAGDPPATWTYAITAGNTGGAFAISNTGQITVANDAAITSIGTFTLTVVLSDDGGLSDTATITVNVTDQNDAPLFTGEPYAFTLQENRPVGTVVGSVTSTDADAGQTVTYAITAGNTGGAFAINAAGQITVANDAAVDFEANPAFTLTVTATDDGAPPLTDTTSVAITLTDVNEAPTADDGAAAVAESAPIGTSVTTVVATDPDIDPPNPPSPNATLVFAITAGNTGGAFAIDPATGVISTAAAPVLANSPYTLTVTVTDGGALSDTAAITITVTDQNDAPTLNDAAFNLVENSANGTAVGTVTATDPDIGQTFTYAITAGNGAGGFAIDAGTGAITVANSAALDFETTPVFVLTVSATDNGAPPLGDTAQVTITLSDANDPPVANDDAMTVAENSANATVVGTYVATDADAGQTLAYAITGGTGAAFFAINAGSGQVTVSDSAGLDFESTPTLTLIVSATDNGAGNLSDTGTITVTLTDVNEAPVANDAAFTVLENSADGTVVGTVVATDVDAGANGTRTFAITAGNTGTAFAIDTNTGVITVATSSEMDFGNVYALTVTVTDGGAPGLTDTATIDITVDDVNEPPAPTATPATPITIGEDTTIGTTVTTIAPNDPEAGQTHTFVFQSGNTGNAFAISAAGVITVDAALDFEGGPQSYSLIVRVTDNGAPALFTDLPVTVNVSDVNEAPVVGAGGTLSYVEGDGARVIDASITVSDPDAGEGIESATVQIGAGFVAIEDVLALPVTPGIASSYNAGTGELTLTGSASPASYEAALRTVTYTNTSNAPSTTSRSVAWSVSDGSLASNTAASTITINTINSAPVITSTIPTAATEDTLYTYLATRTDADGPGQTWSVDGVNNTCAGASIGAASGIYTFTPAGPVPPATCVVAVTVCDGGTPDQCASQMATVTITPVNDAPAIDSTAPATATEDVPYSYAATFTDPDGTGQNWTVLPADTCGGGIGAGTGLYAFTPAGPNPPASCTIAIQVCDAGGLCGPQSSVVTITAVNSAPVINSVAPSPATEDTLYTYNATRTDLDGPGQTWTLTGANTCAGANIVAGTGVYTFTPAGPTPPASCDVGIQVCDGGSPDLCDTDVTTIAITAVNDAPTINSTAPTTATEDTLYTYNATIADPDGPGVTWSVTGGNTCAGSITAGGTYTFTPPGPTPPPTCAVAIQACDNGTPNECVTQSTTVTISAVNDGPANVVPGAQAVDEDTNLVFSGANQIAITDGDAATMQVTLTATNGVLTTNGITGLAFTTGDGAADATMTFSGTLANVNSALNGLIFRGTLHFFGAATLNVTSNDQGSTGSGGALGDSDTINITVNAVNDPPVADDETFDTLGNTELRIDIGLTGTPHVVETTGSGTGVRDGDADPVEAHAFTVTAIVGCADVSEPYDCTLPSGSIVSMMADGDFTFRPSPTLATGAHTPDIFQYVITDQPPVGEGTPATDTGQVTIRVFDKIWYVQRGASGNGRSDNPLGTFAAIHSVGGGGDGDGPGEVIYVHNDATALDSFIELEANQVLLGGGAALTTVRALNGDAPPTLVPVTADSPVRSTAGNTIRIANAIPAEIRGLALGTSAAASNAIDLSTTAATTGLGTLTIADNTFTGATAEGIDVNANSPTALTLAITGNAWDIAGTHSGTAIDISNTNVGANTLRLNVSNNAGVISAGNGIAINGGAVARTTVTGFADNSVHGNTGNTGVVISSVTFDADVVGAGIQQVDGNALLVGVPGNGAGTGGLAFVASQGNLFFDNINVNAEAGAGVSLSGAGTGLTVAVTPASSGGTSAIDADNGPAIDVNAVALDLRLASLQSNTPTTGVSLNTVTGQFSAPNGSQINKASGGGPAFTIASSNVVSDYAGSLNVTAGAGVSLTTNGGSNVTFRGGVSLSTGANPAFIATGGGTVHVCDEGVCNAGATGALVNTLTTTTGTPLNVANTNIGANNLEFRSISSNGATSGIILSATGAGGGLKVKGDGGGTQNASGGLIQNSTGVAINLANTRDVTLTQLNLTNGGNHGINLSSVTNFTYQDAVMTGVADGNDEQGINSLNVFGTSLVEDVTMDDIKEDGIQIRQNATDDGTIDTLTIRRLNIQDHEAGFGESGIEAQPDLASNLRVIVDDCDFTLNTNAVIAAQGSTAASHTGVFAMTIQNSTFNAAGSFGSGGPQFLGGGTGTVFYTVNNNQVISTKFNALTLNSDQSHTTHASVTNNPFSAAAGNNGNGISMRQDENSTMNAFVSGNALTGFSSDGIRLLPQDATVDDAGIEFAGTFTNNTSTVPTSGFGAGLYFEIINTPDPANFFNDTCMDVTGNNLRGTNTAAFFDFDLTLTLAEENGASLRIRQASEAAMSTANTNRLVSTFAANPGGNPIVFNGGACTLPTAPP